MLLSARPQVQALEARQLFTVTSPLLTTIHVDGSVHRISAVVLSFDESLNPVSASDPNSYIFGKVPPPSKDDGITLGDVLGFLTVKAKPGVIRPDAFRSQVWVKLGKIQWRAVDYNDATRSVTLLPVKVFNGAPFFRMLRVRGTGIDAIKDMDGNVFSGGNDAVMRWLFRTGKVLRYTDQDGDRVTLTLKGPGTLSSFLRRIGEPRPTVLVSGTTSKSVLTGTIVQSRLGDGHTSLEQLSGSTVKNNIFGSSHFTVLT
jgi:hypothetical protein